MFVDPAVLYCRFGGSVGADPRVERATKETRLATAMGLGSTAKKVQKLADLAEKMYKRINHMVEQLQELRETVDETGRRVETIEQELEQHRVLLDAIAEEHDIDVDSAVADAVIQDAEGNDLIADADGGSDTDSAASGGTSGNADGSDGST